MARILIVEDELTLCKLMEYNLKQSGYDVSIVHNGKEVFEVLNQEKIDLILLDIMLPGMSGIEICHKLRAKGSLIPIIMVTAKGTEEEIVQGLQAGADDYITKPFGVKELLARCETVLRRSYHRMQNAEQNVDQILRIGAFTINLETYEVFHLEQKLELRPKEFDILVYLVKRKGKVVQREELMSEIWGFDYYGGLRTVDVHMSSLRKKLSDVSDQVFIDSVRGVGYKMIEV